MDDPANTADRDLERFMVRQSTEGRFQRYCAGRMRRLPLRLGIILMCLLAVLPVSAPDQALSIAVCIALLDTFDCWILGVCRRRVSLGSRVKRMIVFTTVTASVQAMSIAGLIVYLAIHGRTATLAFATSIGVAVVLDALSQLKFQRGAAIARLAVYCSAITAAHGLAILHFSIAETLYYHAAAILSLYVVTMFQLQAIRAAVRAERREFDALQSAQSLAKANLDLDRAREEARYLGTVAEQVRDAVVLSSQQGTILWVNKAFTEFTGYTSDQVLGRHVSLLNGPETDPKAVARLIAAREQSGTARVEIVNYHRTGRKIWSETSLTPVFDSEGAVSLVIGVERDIGRIKEREAALAEARRRAEAEAEARHSFIATMSHEIRTPMNGVIGTVDLLAESDLSEAQRALVDTIQRSGDALLGIVNDVLDYSKLESGKLTIASDPFNLMTCVSDAVELVRPLADENSLSLEMSAPENNSLRVVGDPGRLRQVLLNLLGNAIKFTSDGRVRLTVAEDTNKSGVWHFSVQDTGIGIPQERLSQIFETYEQANHRIASRFGGTGLGLAISKRLIEAMGGELSVRSRPGVGSTFKVLVELPHSDPNLSVIGNSYQPKVPTSLKEVTILVADDSQTNTVLLQRMLSPLGADLVFASNGRQAIELWRTKVPDLILMDMHMPEVSGVEAAYAIREEESLLKSENLSPVPILALTASAFSDDRSLCINAGMSAFLSKPFRKRELLTVIGDLLQSRNDSFDTRCAKQSI